MRSEDTVGGDAPGSRCGPASGSNIDAAPETANRGSGARHPVRGFGAGDDVSAAASPLPPAGVSRETSPGGTARKTGRARHGDGPRPAPRDRTPAGDGAPKAVARPPGRGQGGGRAACFPRRFGRRARSGEDGRWPPRPPARAPTRRFTGNMAGTEGADVRPESGPRPARALRLLGRGSPGSGPGRGPTPGGSEGPGPALTAKPPSRLGR